MRDTSLPEEPMSNKESQQQINDREWSNQENWAGSKWFGVYFCKLDSRLFVPKRSFPGFGWTFNLGHPSGPRLFYSVTIIVPMIIMVLSTVLFLGLGAVIINKCSASATALKNETLRIQNQ